MTRELAEGVHSPLISIVVPTHNRARYAIPAIRSLLAFEAGSEVLEVVVHDTSTNADLHDWSVDKAASDGRLRYVHCSERLDLAQNHNRALALCNGRYVCLIGDDDTVLPDLLNLAQYAETNDIDCVAPRLVASYAWPDFVTRTFGSAHAGRLYFSRTYGHVEKKDARAALTASLKIAAQGTDGLPKLYHGLVKRDVLEGIRQKTGDYFHGTSPDVSAAIAIAASIDSFIELDFPVTLPGASGGSNTGASAMGQHEGDLAKSRQTARYAADWPSLVPAFYSVETVWGHAAFETLRVLGHPAIDQFNFPKLYTLCLIRHRHRSSCTFQSMKSYLDWSSTSAAALTYRCGISAVSIISKEAARLARRALTPTAAGNRRYFDGHKTVEEARVQAIQVIETDKKNLSALLQDEEGV